MNLKKGFEIQRMLDVQRSLQLVYNKGKDISDFTDEERMAELRNNALALFAEIFEALDECGWKPWASSNHLNASAFKGEMVDAFHFFMNLMLHGGMSGNDLFEGYLEKSERNLRRQEEGYDGVTGKCPICKRDFGDIDAHAEPGDRKFYINGVRYCSEKCAVDSGPFPVSAPIHITRGASDHWPLVNE